MREHCAREAPRDYELLPTSSRVQWWSVTQNLCMAGHAYGLDHLKDALGPREARNRSLGRDQSDSNDHQNDSQDISQALLGDTGRQVAAKYDSWN
jgi:hypothetical protein